MPEPTENRNSNDPVKLGIIICDRYRTCAGGKCFRSVRNREGAFSVYKGRDVEVVGFATCDGCPGGNVEYCPEELKNNGAQIIHLATGLVVGYPPCPYIDDFCRFIERHYGMQAVIGTHPIPQKYYLTHQSLGTWSSSDWGERIKHVLGDEKIRLSYD